MLWRCTSTIDVEDFQLWLCKTIHLIRGGSDSRFSREKNLFFHLPANCGACRGGIICLPGIRIPDLSNRSRKKRRDHANLWHSQLPEQGRMSFRGWCEMCGEIGSLALQGGDYVTFVSETTWVDSLEAGNSRTALHEMIGRQKQVGRCSV